VGRFEVAIEDFGVGDPLGSENFVFGSLIGVIVRGEELTHFVVFTSEK
jgi:hypothetical protein